MQKIMSTQQVNWIKPMCNRLIYILCMLSAILQLTACSTNKEKIFAQPMPTMKAVHDEKFKKIKGLNKHDVHRVIQDSVGDLQGPVKDIYQKTQKGFELLPNPTLTIYIYRHLTSGGRPVPGYSSYFKFYQQDQYALPGEAEGW